MTQEATSVRIRRGSGRDKEARYREGCDKEGRDRRDVIAVGKDRHLTDVMSA